MRVAVVAMAFSVVVAACSGDSSTSGAGKTLSQESLQKDCANPRWKEQNLGLWYSVCRKPVSW